MPSPAGAALDDGRGVTIAVDAMGGDHGPGEVVPGAIDHARAHPEDRVILVGDEAVIRRLAGSLPANVSIVPASQVVGMAAAVLRLGGLPGVERPALAVMMITATGPMVLLDSGANPDSTPENLVQY